LFCLSSFEWWATCCPPDFRFWVSAFHPLSAASIRRKRAVGLGEHCLSTWPRSGSCELRSPARLRLIEGTPQGRQTGVAFFLVTFSLAKQEKVTSCRATPDGVVFFHVGHATLCPTYALPSTVLILNLKLVSRAWPAPTNWIPAFAGMTTTFTDPATPSPDIPAPP
jgi:hypothetical protein